MNVVFCLLGEDDDIESYLARENLHWAWKQWRLESCVEWNGGHSWELTLEHPDDGRGASLACAHCPASTDDLYPDGDDLLWFDHEGVKVEAGQHNQQEEMIIPVDVDVRVERHLTPEWDEYDVYIDIYPRK